MPAKPQRTKSAGKTRRQAVVPLSTDGMMIRTGSSQFDTFEGSVYVDREAFDRKYTARLNAQQAEAVHAVDGAVLLLAVPGSGKTTVLVTRLGYMICCCKIPADKILTMTYGLSFGRAERHPACRDAAQKRRRAEAISGGTQALLRSHDTGKESFVSLFLLRSRFDVHRGTTAGTAGGGPGAGRCFWHLGDVAMRETLSSRPKRARNGTSLW